MNSKEKFDYTKLNLMKKIFNLFTKQVAFAFAFMLSVGMLSAQCPAGQTNVDITYATGGFNGENGWSLYDKTTGTELACDAMNPSAGVTSVCVTDNNNICLVTFETFGDGWCAPAAITIAVNEDASVNACESPNGAEPGTNVLLYDSMVDGGIASGTPAYACTGDPIAAGGFSTFAFRTYCPTCAIVCPDDIVVENAPGTCESTPVAIADPTFFPDGCNLETPVDTSVLMVSTTPSGFGTLPANSGVVDTAIVSIPIPAAACMPLVSCQLEVCIDIILEGDFSLGATTEEVSVAIPELGGFTYTTVNQGDCNQVTIGTVCLDADQWLAVSDDCAIDVTFTQDDGTTFFNPTLCGTDGVVLEFSLFTECDIFNTTGLAADGVYPVGCTEVCYLGTGSGTGSG